MAKIKRIICLVLTLAIVAVNLTAFAYTTPPDVSAEQVLARAEELRIKLNEKYFTVDTYPCVGGSNSGTSHYNCDNCFNEYIVNDTDGWFRQMFGEVDVENFPVVGMGHGVSHPRAWTCAGFANFAAWFLFKGENTDKVVFNLVVENIPVTHENLRTYCKPGDGIRISNGHSIIYLSENSYFDGNAGGRAHANIVKFHDRSLADTSYAGKLMSVYRAENYVDSLANEPAESVDSAIQQVATDTVLYNGYTYKVFSEALSWNDANEKCKSLGGQLATVSSQQELQAINTLMKNYSGSEAYWIGAYRNAANGETQYKWITDSEVAVSNWNVNQPSFEYYGTVEEYVGIYGGTGLWNDFHGNSSTIVGFVCQWETPTSESVQTEDTQSVQKPMVGVSNAQNGVSEWGEWSEWSQTPVYASENCQVETKTQYGYYHYILSWDDTDPIGAYPINAVQMDAQYGIDTPEFEEYHEYWSDTQLSPVQDSILKYVVDGEIKTFEKYENTHCAPRGKRVSSINGLYSLEKTRTVYRYRTISE